MKLKDFRKLPSSPGVYFFKSDSETLYIGKANSLRERVSSYFLKSDLGPKTRAMLEKAKSIDFIRVDSEFEALLLESRLINKYKPPYNITSRDDKSPLYIVITKERFPRVRTTRQKELSNFPKASVFGPFPSGASVKWLLRRLRHIFPFCETKSDIGQPCLHSHIGLCNPCPRDITRSPNPTKEDLYKVNLKNLKRVLSGNLNGLAKILSRDMNTASDKNDFEKAAIIRNQINKLEWLKAAPKDTEEYLVNPNLVEDQEKQALLSLQNLFHLKSTPVRIECYDVSHLGKSAATAAMVVATDGHLDNGQYRHFKIKFTQVPNDVAAISETLNRRFSHPQWKTPDLIVIDGGLPQISAALSAVKFPNLPIVSLAKRLEEIYMPGDSQPIRLSPRDPGHRLLIMLRNEAHRFSRRLHHKLRSKNLFA